MGTTARLLPLPQDTTLYVSAISATDPLNKNDAEIRVIFGANVTGLTIDAFSVSGVDSNGDAVTVKVVETSLEGQNSVYAIKVRPPDTDNGTLTLTLAADAVTEGNSETTLTLKYTDGDKETDWDLLFETTVDYTALLESRPAAKDGYFRLVSADGIDAFDYNRPQLSRYTRTVPTQALRRAIPFGNGGYLNFPDNNIELVNTDGDAVWTSDRLQKDYNGTLSDLTLKSVALTPDGTLLMAIRESGGTYGVIEYTLAEIQSAITEGTTTLGTAPPSVSFSNGNITVPAYTASLVIGNDRDTGKIYVSDHNKVYTYDADRNIIEDAVLTTASGETSVFIGGWGGDLYRFTTDGNLYAIGTSRLTKPTPREHIHPIFIAPGEKFDLTTLLPNFEKGVGQVVFDLGFDKEAWFEIVDDRYIRVEDDYEGDAALIAKLLAINANGFVPFSFYLIVKQTLTPEWLRFQTLCVDASKPLNLLDYVLDAAQVLWKHGFTSPTDVTLDGSVITIADTVTDPIEVELTAWNGNRTADHAFTLVPIRDIEIPIGFKRFKIYIEGIDVSADLLEVPTLSESLDSVKVDVYTISSSEIVLHNRHGRYNYRIAGNFWETHNLNPYGYLNSIEIYVEVWNGRENPTYTPYLLFQGVIIANIDPLSEVSVRLKASDISYHLRKSDMRSNRLGIRKAAETQAGRTAAIEGVYRLATEMQPALASDANAQSDRRAITLKDTANPTISAVRDYTGFLTETDVRTEGGLLDEAVLMRYKTPHRRVPAEQALHYLSKTDRVYSVSADIHIPELDEAFFSPRGNVAYNTEPGRTERVPVDWIYDATDKQMYVLLSAPDAHIASHLIQVDYETHRSHLLYAFESGRTAWQLTSEDFDTFYILTAASTDGIDRSAENAARDTQCTAYSYDAAAPESDTRIIGYHKSFGDTTDFIDTDADYPPQVGCHYWTGFGNAYYQNQYQGIVAHTRSRFIATDGSLYYRYATDTEFGVAKAPADGTGVTALFTETHDAFFNHLNFAFDIDSTGDVYMASVQGTESGSTLKIEKYVSGGDNEVSFEETKTLGSLTDIDSEGGAWLGVQELVVKGDHFYYLMSVMREGRRYDVCAAGAIYHYYAARKKQQLLYHSDFLHWGACALTRKDGIVYFAETPQHAYKLLPINPDLDTYDTEAGYNLLDIQGSFKCIEAGGMLRDLGNIWFANEALHGVYTRGLVTDDGIDLMTGTGNPDTLAHPNNPLADPEKQQWITYTKKLHYYMHQIPTGGSPYQEIVNLASKMNASFFIDRGIVKLKDNQPYSARLTGTIGTTVPYAGANKPFPDSGYLLIDREIIKYDSKTDTEFTGLTRHIGGTNLNQQAYQGEDTRLTARNPTIGTAFIFIDRIMPIEATIESERGRSVISSGRVLDIFQSFQITQFYNQIVDVNNRVRKNNIEDLEHYGERTFRLSTDLTSNDIDWLAWLAAVYLNRLSGINNQFRLRLTHALHLSVGDIVAFYWKDIFLVPLRIIELEHSENTYTAIVGKQVKPQGVVPAEPALPAGETYRTLDGRGDPMFVDGLGDSVIFTGDEFNFGRGQIKLRFESTEIPDQVFDENVPIPTLHLPKAVIDDAGTEPDGVVYRLTGSLAGLAFDAGACTLSGFPNTDLAETALTYTATYDGESVTLTFNIEVNADTSGSFLTLDGFGDPFFVDGSGDGTVFNG